jgi:hypothetical protein
LRPTGPDERAIRELSRSPYVKAIAGALLKNLDRDALAELLAAYIYMSSEGDVDFVALMRYAVSSRPNVWVGVGAGAAPAVLMGILTDKAMRSAVLSSVASWLRRVSGQN